jgi:hypothetical protein
LNSNTNPWRQSLNAARANIAPGLVLQAIALTLLVAYYLIPTAHLAFDRVAAVKSQLGVLFSVVSTSICGGLIPYLYLRINPVTRPLTPPSHLLFYTVFWAYKGFEVDTLYRIQSLVFGSGHSFNTLFAKVICDQFLYNPFWSAPIAVFFFHWKETGFSLKVLRETHWPDFFRKALPSALISTWGVWIPTVALIYCLPTALQVPLFNVVLCFWVLFLTSLTRQPKG